MADSNNKQFCTNCGESIPDGARFCSHCGQAVAPDTVRPSKRRRGCLITLAVILFLGVVGVGGVFLYADDLISYVISSQLPEELRNPLPVISQVALVERPLPVGINDSNLDIRRPAPPPLFGAATVGEIAELEEPDLTNSEEINPSSVDETQQGEPTSQPPSEVTPTELPITPTTVPVPSPTFTPIPTPAFGELNGRIVFTHNPFGHEDSGHEIFVLNLTNGNLDQLTFNNVPDWDPDWSPDGRQIAFVSFQNNNYDIWTMNPDGSNQIPIIVLSAWDDYPVWAPDGRNLTFVTTGETNGVSNSEIFVVNDTGGDAQRLTFNERGDEWPTWSPDSLWIANSSNRDGDYDIYLTRIDGSETVNWTNDSIYNEQPTWSPDGEWIAFVRKDVDTNGNGRLDRRDDGDYGNIWIGRTDGSEFRQLTFSNQDADPAWSPNGQYVVYAHFIDSNGDGKYDLNDNSELHVIKISGGDPILIMPGNGQNWTPDWTVP